MPYCKERLSEYALKSVIVRGQTPWYSEDVGRAKQIFEEAIKNKIKKPYDYVGSKLCRTHWSIRSLLRRESLKNKLE